MPLGRVVAVVEEFSLGSPAQQLVDRFGIGFPRDGRWHRPEVERLTVCAVNELAESDRSLIERRVDELGFCRSADLEAAVAEAAAILLVPGGPGDAGARDLLHRIVPAAARDACIFVHGLLAADAQQAKTCVHLVREARGALLAGSYLQTTWRLPSREMRDEVDADEVMVVLGGEPGHLAFRATDALVPLIVPANAPAMPGADVRTIEGYAGDEVWQALDRGELPRDLLASAISRSDTPQGDAVRDGRTQDLVRLGLLPELVHAPVARVVEHENGLRSVVVLLSGAIADVNFAVRKADGEIVSAQLYCPPPPNEHHWSTLAAVAEEFFATGVPAWGPQRSVLASELYSTFLPDCRLE